METVRGFCYLGDKSNAHGERKAAGGVSKNWMDEILRMWGNPMWRKVFTENEREGL